MVDVTQVVPAEAATSLTRRKQPSWVEPTLATLTDKRFSDPNWLFEPKFDGERCLVFRSGGDVWLLTRNRKRVGDRYPELAEALAKQDCDDFIADGEIVAFDRGVSSFSKLQQRMQISDPESARATGIAVYFYLFDLIYANGYDLRKLELLHRKHLLAQLVSFADPLRFTTHREEDGEAYWEEACSKGLEGVIAKRADATYQSRRSTDWLKFKCVNAQEMVIGGYTDPKGSRTGIGALLLGYYEDNRLAYAGKVGTGFDQRTLRQLREELSDLERSSSPFPEEQRRSRSVHWVRPELVAQIEFTEWTKDGQLRHPRFQGLRRDKKASQVVRERPSA